MSSKLELENQCKDDWLPTTPISNGQTWHMLSANIRYYKKKTNIDVSTLLIGESIIDSNADSVIFV